MLKTRFLLLCGVAGLAFTISGCTQCTRQHDPKPALNVFHHEREVAQEKIPLLTEEGRIPAPKDASGHAVASADPIEQKYAQLCAACHGESGKADGPAGLSLNPRPRNFTDAAWQGKTGDDRITNVIKNGGAANGLSAAMAPWGSILSDTEVAGLVKKIRAFKGK